MKRWLLMIDYKCTQCDSKIDDRELYIEDEHLQKIKETALVPTYWKAVDKKVVAVYCSPECSLAHHER